MKSAIKIVSLGIGFLLISYSIQLNSQSVSTLVAEFPGDGEISFDTEGNIYLNDSGENGNLDGDAVYKVTPDGDFSLFHDGLPIWVVGSMYDHDGHLLVTGWQEGTISRITPDGSSSETIANDINGAGSLEIDEEGNIYVVEFWTHSVKIKHKDSTDTTTELYAGGYPIQFPAGLAYDAEKENLYISNWTDSNICKISSDSSVTVFASLPDSVPNVGPIKIFGNYMYATSPEYHMIFRINMLDSKEVTLFAGTGEKGNLDGDISTATFNTPTGIGTLDGETFYVAETYQNTGRLRAITGVTTSIDHQTHQNETTGFTLRQNMPNPFHQQTKITYELEKTSHVTLKIFDISGNLIAQPIDRKQSKGSYELKFPDNLAGLKTLKPTTLKGVLYYQLIVNGKSETMKMIAL